MSDLPEPPRIDRGLGQSYPLIVARLTDSPTHRLTPFTHSPSHLHHPLTHSPTHPLKRKSPRPVGRGSLEWGALSFRLVVRRSMLAQERGDVEIGLVEHVRLVSGSRAACRR